MQRLVLSPLVVCGCLALLSVPFNVTAQTADVAVAEESRPAISVIPLAHAPVHDVFEHLGEVAKIQGIELTIDHRTNSIILIGDEEGIETIEALCQVIDAAPRMIDIEVALYELLGEAAAQEELTPEMLDSPESIRVIRRIRLQSLENQMTTIQLGETVPVKTGEVFAGRGGPPGAAPQAQAIYEMENLGTLITCNSRVSGDTITMELSIETSSLRSADESENELNLSAKTVGQLQTTVSLTPGEPTIIGDFASLDAPADTRFVVVVTARLR